MLVLKREEGKGLEILCKGLETFYKGVEYFFGRNIRLMFTKKGYSSLFRAGVFLCLTWGVVVQFVFTNFAPYEKEAHALMYKVEFETKIEYESIGKLECSRKNQPKAVFIDCKHAQYLYSNSSAGLKILEDGSVIVYVFIGLAFILSIIGFLFREPDG